MLALITEARFEPRTVKVARVIDGDTIQVLSDGRQYAVRLIGADTPETKHPTEAVQRFGQEASAFTTAAFEGRTVQLETDRTGDTVDRYGRLLCYVYLDGQNFNARLISEGYAHAIRGFRYSERAARCARIETCADRITGAGVAMYRLPSPGPVCPDAKPAPDRASPHLWRLSRTLL